MFHTDSNSAIVSHCSKRHATLFIVVSKSIRVEKMIKRISWEKQNSVNFSTVRKTKFQNQKKSCTCGLGWTWFFIFSHIFHIKITLVNFWLGIQTFTRVEFIVYLKNLFQTGSINNSNWFEEIGEKWRINVCQIVSK